MQNFQFVNEHMPVVEDLNGLQTFLANASRNRVTDFRSWGILRENTFPATMSPIPVSSVNATPNLNPKILEFPVRFDTSAGLIYVGSGSSVIAGQAGGIAYNLSGERIAILEDAAYDANTTTAYGKKSSGNLGIPVPALGTYYLWIEYLEVNDPGYSKVTRDGVTTYPNILDGYQFRLTATPDAIGGDGNSIFLAKIIWGTVTSGFLEIFGSTEVTDGFSNLVSAVPTAIATEPKRVYCLERMNNVEVVPTAAAKPAAYALGGRYTLGDHVCATGSGTVTPNNPHGLSRVDLEGGTEEPIASTLIEEGLARGIVDTTIPQNSPANQSTALAPTFNTNALTPQGVDTTTIAGSGISADLSQDGFIRVAAPITGQAAYVGGIRFTALYPTLAQTVQFYSDPLNKDAWVGFSSADVTGTYAIFGSPAKLSDADVLLLRKTLVASGTGLPASIPSIDDINPDSLGARLLVSYVFWNASDNSLHTQYDNATAAATGESAPDNRSLGLVGPQQISTEAKSSPETGSLTGQSFENLIGNGNFLLDKVSSAFPGWEIYSTNGVGYIEGAQILRNTDASLSTVGGPGAVSAVKITPQAINNTLLQTHMYAKAGDEVTSKFLLKPSTKYCISFWYNAAETWNSSFRVGLSSNHAGVNSSIITTGGTQPLEVLLVQDAGWHKASIVVETKSSVVYGTGYYLELRFKAPDAVAAGDLTLTNIQVTEGEWVSGYNAGMRIPQEGIFLWDKTTTCPPGSVEVTAMTGRLPIAADILSGSNGLQLVGNPNAATPATNYTLVGGHTHDLVLAAGVIGGGGAYTQTTSQPSPNHLPLYTVLYCRAL